MKKWRGEEEKGWSELFLNVMFVIFPQSPQQGWREG